MNKRQTIKIATPHGMVSVRARSIAPGLAVHLTNLGDCIAPLWKWGVTHIPSGKHIISADTQPKAVKMARELAEITDWSKIDENNPPEEARRKVGELRKGLP